jgi:hypothetical protein
MANIRKYEKRVQIAFHTENKLKVLAMEDSTNFTDWMTSAMMDKLEKNGKLPEGFKIGVEE